MADFTVPSREELFDDFMASYRGEFPEKNSSQGSDGWRLGRVVSGVFWLVMAKLFYVVKEMLPDTAVDFLPRWEKIYKFPKRGPTTSQGAFALSVTGTPGTPVTQGLELAHSDGSLYEVASSGLAIAGGGSVLVSVASITTGLRANKAIGETLTFTAPPPGIDDNATLVGKLTGGLDNEDPDVYRQRLEDHLGDPPEGGALHDYKEWALRVTGALNAYVYQHRRGLGTIDVAVLQGGHGADRIIADLTPFQAYIDSVRPGGMKDFKLLVVVPQVQDITVFVEADEANYPWDWDDAGVDWPITAFNAGAKTITVPTAPATVKAGVRLTVEGEEATVVAVAGGGLLSLTFANDIDDNPVAWFTFDITGKAIRSSGDLVVPVRNAILAKFDKLGPARGPYAAFSWDDGVRRAKIEAAAADVAGDVDVDVIVPLANVTPVDPALALPPWDAGALNIPLLVPGFVRVWKL